MGQASNRKPARLGEKLLAIRNGLNLSQNEMIRALGQEGELTQSQLSAFERGARIPSLHTLLSFAYLVGIHLEIIVDDELDLPKKFSK